MGRISRCFVFNAKSLKSLWLWLMCVCERVRLCGFEFVDGEVETKDLTLNQRLVLMKLCVVVVQESLRTLVKDV